jgi:glutathione peroxidase
VIAMPVNALITPHACARRAVRLLLSLTVFLMSALTMTETAHAACAPLLNHTFQQLQDKSPQPLCQYQGKVVLVVNTASYCGFTRQYDGLEKLYANLKAKGLVVVGFPSNNFGNQEPGSEKEIADFCRLTYGVQFPMMSKTEVVGGKAHPFFQELAKTTGDRPQWNFHKYLIDRSGRKVASFSSRVEPNSPELTSAIERLLAEQP